MEREDLQKLFGLSEEEAERYYNLYHDKKTIEELCEEFGISEEIAERCLYNLVLREELFQKKWIPKYMEEIRQFPEIIKQLQSINSFLMSTGYFHERDPRKIMIDELILELTKDLEKRKRFLGIKPRGGRHRDRSPQNNLRWMRELGLKTGICIEIFNYFQKKYPHLINKVDNETLRQRLRKSALPL